MTAKVREQMFMARVKNPDSRSFLEAASVMWKGHFLTDPVEIATTHVKMKVMELKPAMKAG